MHAFQDLKALLDPLVGKHAVYQCSREVFVKAQRIYQAMGGPGFRISELKPVP
jgi:hypothetical protein